MDRPTVSIVAPVFNEADIIDELVARCLGILERVHGSAELLLVDDASTDATRERLRACADRDARLRLVLLDKNVGQFRATQRGLTAARGAVVVTLDGDLQDPPELIPALVRQLRANPQLDVVFAQKLSREDPLWVKAGAWLYRRLQRLLCGARWPGAVGSFTAMHAALAGEVAGVDMAHANLAAVIVSLHARFDALGYHRDPRRNGESRVGLWGLVCEAWGSLRVSGGLWSEAFRGLASPRRARDP